MARHRKYGEDLTYSEAHRYALPDLYGRIGHRLDLCDRDFTEFCHFCKQPLLLVETVRDVGQDLLDKATTVTRRLAESSRCEAVLVGWRIERTPEDEQEIEALNRRIREIEQRSPLRAITVRPLWPRLGSLVQLPPAEWWKHVLIIHRDHHRVCRSPNAREWPVHLDRLVKAIRMHPLHVPGLFDGVD